MVQCVVGVCCSRVGKGEVCPLTTLPLFLAFGKWRQLPCHLLVFCQVLPDSTTTTPVVGDPERLRDKQAYQTAFAAWCEQKRTEEKLELEKAAEEIERLSRVSNMHWLCALDHALLSGSGLSLASFAALDSFAEEAEEDLCG